MYATILLFLLAAVGEFKQLIIQDIPLEVELASTPETRAKGLSGRKELLKGKGMLFVFDQPQICHFWMKDTAIPLSIGFFDQEKNLIEWVDMPPPGEKKLSVVSSRKRAQYALEVPKGWFAEHNIQPGAQFSWIQK